MADEHDEEVCPMCKQGIPRGRILVVGGVGSMSISASLLAKTASMVHVVSVEIDAPPAYAKIKKVAPYGKKAKRGGGHGKW